MRLEVLCCFLLGVLLSLPQSVEAQNLQSEIPPGERVFIQNVEGSAPGVLSCRLSKQESLDCVSNAELRSVSCEAQHFSKKTLLPGKIAGRAFRCPGTPYDGGSLFSAWKAVVRDKSGNQSEWMIESLNKQQAETLYKLEHRYTNRRSDGEVPTYSLGVVSAFGLDDSGTSGNSLGFSGGWQWTDYWIGGQLVTSNATGPATFEIGAEYVFSPRFFDSASGPRSEGGWYLAADIGRYANNGQAWSKQCVSLGYKWRPGRMYFSTKLGNCWLPNQTRSWGPQSQIRVARYLADSFLLGLVGDGIFTLGESEDAPNPAYTARILLTASFLLQAK